MNIFESRHGILGSNDFLTHHNVLAEFLETARDIRRALGNQAYKLDSYIGILIEAFADPKTADLANDGFICLSPLQRLCIQAVKGNMDDHPFAPEVKRIMETYPMPYQEATTRYSIYICLLADQFLDTIINEFCDEYYSTVSCMMDMTEVNHLYNDIVKLLGNESLMEHLNELFIRRFIATPAVNILYQAAASYLLDLLIYRDSETSKQIYQLLIAG